MKTNRYRIAVAVCFILAMLTLAAKAAGPATNIVTLHWDAPTNSYVPYVYEVEQTLSLVVPVWTVIAANIPSNTPKLTLSIDKDLKFWRVCAVNATNSAWKSDFSNVASTLWPGQGGNLGIRLGL